MRQYNNQNATNIFDDEPRYTRYFLKFFKTKAKTLRKGILSSVELKKQVIAIGRGKKVDITRLAYDGTPEQPPIAVKIIDIGNDHFTGKVVNVERSISEGESEKLIFVKGGGGTVDFYFADGDIVKIVQDIDEEIVQQRNIDEVKEILEALDLNEDINISYYDRDKGGVINGVGILSDKNLDTFDFKVSLKMINDIELKQDRVVSLNLNRDQILDLEVVI
jgi:hypothetical protein